MDKSEFKSCSQCECPFESASTKEMILIVDHLFLGMVALHWGGASKYSTVNMARRPVYISPLRCCNTISGSKTWGLV